jgi:hypothetical protein
MLARISGNAILPVPTPISSTRLRPRSSRVSSAVTARMASGLSALVAS